MFDSKIIILPVYLNTPLNDTMARIVRDAAAYWQSRHLIAIGPVLRNPSTISLASYDWATVRDYLASIGYPLDDPMVSYLTIFGGVTWENAAGWGVRPMALVGELAVDYSRSAAWEEWNRAVGLIAHELGHVLGYGHQTNSVMWEWWNGVNAPLPITTPMAHLASVDTTNCPLPDK